MVVNEHRQIELMNAIAKLCRPTEDASGVLYVIDDMGDFVNGLYNVINQNTRCHKDIQEFIDYMNENPDQRFWQGVRNFTGVKYLLTAETFDEKNNTFSGIDDTFYHEKITKRK